MSQSGKGAVEDLLRDASACGLGSSRRARRVDKMYGAQVFATEALAKVDPEALKEALRSAFERV